MNNDTKKKKPLLEKLQKYESLIAGGVLLVGLTLFVGFIIAFLINAKTDLDTFITRTSSAQWENTIYSGMYFNENKLTFSQNPYGDIIVEKCVIFSGINLTADSNGTTVLVDDENRKVDSTVFISDAGERIEATSTSNGVVFVADGNKLSEFFLDGYIFFVNDGKVKINNYDLATYGDIKIPITTTTTITTTSPQTTTPEKTTSESTSSTLNTTLPDVSENVTVTTKKPTVVTTTVTTTQKPVTTTKKPTTTTKKKTTTTVTVYNTKDAFVNEVLKLVNAERKKAGLKELKGMIALDRAATIRAQEITGDDKNFSHTRPSGKEWYTVLAEVGISPMAAGENLAAGQTTPEMVVGDWMASEDHKANILDPEYQYVGLGYVKYDGYYYWAQLFASF